jgi:hypothetical protein
MAGLYAPLPTLRSRPRGRLRTARGRRGLLFLHRRGLSPHTPCRSPGALTRVAACTLALSPIRDTLSEGFSHFVTSIAAPAGSSGCQVGLAPTGKHRLITAHTQSRLTGRAQLRTARFLNGLIRKNNHEIVRHKGVTVARDQSNIQVSTRAGEPEGGPRSGSALPPAGEEVSRVPSFRSTSTSQMAFVLPVV